MRSFILLFPDRKATTLSRRDLPKKGPNILLFSFETMGYIQRLVRHTTFQREFPSILCPLNFSAEHSHYKFTNELWKTNFFSHIKESPISLPDQLTPYDISTFSFGTISKPTSHKMIISLTSLCVLPPSVLF